MRTTKKQLEEQIANLLAQRESHLTELYRLKEEVAMLKQYSLGGMTSSLVISAERIADAAAHLVSDARQMIRR